MSEIFSMQLHQANLYQNPILKNIVFLYLGLNELMFILLNVYTCFYTHMQKFFCSSLQLYIFIYKTYIIHTKIYFHTVSGNSTFTNLTEL